jgi:hypothetical protein
MELIQVCCSWRQTHISILTLYTITRWIPQRYFYRIPLYIRSEYRHYCLRNATPNILINENRRFGETRFLHLHKINFIALKGKWQVPHKRQYRRHIQNQHNLHTLQRILKSAINNFWKCLKAYFKSLPSVARARNAIQAKGLTIQYPNHWCRAPTMVLKAIRHKAKYLSYSKW